MTTIPTNFQRPDFDTDYEEVESDGNVPDKNRILVSDGEACCDCTPTNTSVCGTEDDMAHFVGSSAGYFGAFWFK